MVGRDVDEHPLVVEPKIRMVVFVEYSTRYHQYAVYISDSDSPALDPLTSCEHHNLHREVVVDEVQLIRHIAFQDA